MKDLEDAARPIASPLILAKGDLHALTLADQRTLANWALLKCLVFSLTSPAGAPVSEMTFRRFYEARRQLAGVTLLAAYAGSHYVAWGQVVGHSEDGVAEDTPRIYTITLFMGRLIVQHIGSNLGDFLYSQRNGFLRIWPPQEREALWPDGRVGFRDADLPRVFHPDVAVVD